MGVVYEASSQTLGRRVALKVLLSGTGATEHDRARFLVEAKAASMLRHPNIVRGLEYRQAEGETYLALNQPEQAKAHLAFLDDDCWFGCEEYDDLKEAIEQYEAKGGS